MIKKYFRSYKTQEKDKMNYYYMQNGGVLINYDTLNENSTRAIQPAKITKTLKENQLTILHATQLIETNGKEIPIQDDNGEVCKWYNTQICIIADKVGSGKSLSTLAIIANKPSITPDMEMWSYSNKINLKKKQNVKLFGMNVLVVPHSIYKQWEKYIQEDTRLKYYGIQLAKHLKNNKSYYDNYELILVASTQYNKFADLFDEKDCVSRLIFDEADSIKIPACKQIRACKYYFISASIDELRFAKIPHNGFIKNTFLQLQACPVDYFKKIVLKNTDEFIQKSFALQDPIKKIIRCKSPLLLNILSGLINDEVIQMINAGDIEGVFQKYDMQITDDTNVVKLICQKYFDQLENLNIKYEMKQKMKFSTQEGKVNALNNVKIQIAEVKSKIKAIEERVQNADVCGICLDDFINKSLTPCCNNVFCFECLSMALTQRGKCPMCNQQITNIKDIIILDNEDTYSHLHQNPNVYQSEKEDLDKIDHFKKLIKTFDKNTRLLVFSEYDASFNQMLSILDENALIHSKIFGTSTHINSTIQKYRDGKIQCLLLNARYFGSGINLENTTDIIIYHHMNSDLKKQVIGRAQRPGRVSQLRIYELCYDNEI